MSRSSVAAVTRIGWRNIRRNRGRSALIVLLMLLPVAAMAGAITLLVTVTPSAEYSATHRMGMADYEVQAGGVEATTDSLRAVLPAGAQVEPWSYDLVRLVLPGRSVDVDARSMDLDGLARGKLVITDGRQPRDQQEVAVSAGLAALADVGLGDRIELEGWGALTIVGQVEDNFNIRGALVLLDASIAREFASGERLHGSPAWLVSLSGGGLEDAPWLDDPMGCGMDGCAFYGYSRSFAPTSSSAASAGVLVLGGLALVEAILVAAAAFAVGVRRRQRELGLLAAAGAERRHLAGTVLSEGALLGGLAALFGVGIGVAAVVAASPWLDELTNRRIEPVAIDAGFLLAAGGIGLLACLLAAALPARAAARMPVLMALSGRRPPQSSAGRVLVVGLALITGGALLTAVGASMRLNDPNAGLLSSLLLLGGAILGVIGFGACSPWLIERLERLGMRLPPAARIALRDTARARSRTSPIVTAILAAFAATVAVSSYFASNDAVSAANWRPWLRADQIILHGEGAGRAGSEAAAELDALAAAPIPWLVGTSGREAYAVVEDPDAAEEEREVAWALTVGDAQVLTALGAEAATADVDAGRLILLMQQAPERELRNATVVVRDAASGAELSALTLPATVIATGLLGGGPADAIVSSAIAERLGLSAGATSTHGESAYVIRLARPVVEADLALAATFAAQQTNTYADAALGPTRPDQLFRLLLVIVSLLFALSVTGIAVALGEAESRPDQRTLLAVGADPGIRRRIAAARAGVLALMAGLLAVPAGLLPAWGILSSGDAPLVVPLLEVSAAVIVLPLAGILGALLLARRLPAWSALRQTSS